MEFTEMKKIWNSQESKMMFAFDVEAIQQKVLHRKKKAFHIADRSEKIMIGALFFAAAIIIIASVLESRWLLFPNLMALTTLSLGVFIWIQRAKRLSRMNQFDSSILGHMDAALAQANYQVRLSQLGKWIYVVVSIIAVLSVLDSWSEWYQGLFVAIFFAIGYLGARWEHQALYVSQQKQLLAMREELIKWELE